VLSYSCRSHPFIHRSPSWLNLIRAINPEFKDFPQTWGWRMITLHEKMYP
jgi:hypothetical protein